jgi:hypothetical protein
MRLRSTGLRPICKVLLDDSTIGLFNPFQHQTHEAFEVVPSMGLSVLSPNHAANELEKGASKCARRGSGPHARVS